MTLIKEQKFGKCIVRMTEQMGQYKVICTTEGGGCASNSDLNAGRALYNKWFHEARALEAAARERANQASLKNRVIAPPKATPKAMPVVTTTQLQNTVEIQAKEMSELRAEIRKLQEQQKNDAADKKNLQNQIDRLNAKLDHLIQVLVNRR